MKKKMKPLLSNVLIKADGTIRPIQPKYGKTYSPDELKTAIGGYYIELVYLDGGRTMVVAEEGIWWGLPFNSIAMAEAGRPIVGDVLIVDDELIK